MFRKLVNTVKSANGLVGIMQCLKLNVTIWFSFAELNFAIIAQSYRCFPPAVRRGLLSVLQLA